MSDPIESPEAFLERIKFNSCGYSLADWEDSAILADILERDARQHQAGFVEALEQVRELVTLPGVSPDVDGKFSLFTARWLLDQLAKLRREVVGHNGGQEG